ncbi:hypothetical protein E5082_10490 [Streptomyces griseoluteus]|uniref:Uncharacterized protein n=1 Tax=Streptomyces griseoluteus TaxID=29306 RepID=A0A4Z1DKT4_STRGP|nr:hypothetical protein [Streptomyces griseoluteus]TGN84781.1 hypothetical protein E5082_10490 [Streptomyces griseoluteus]GHF01324.1 hypothetical protein GCM10017776_18280 [Streptomyces griseoluteus]
MGTSGSYGGSGSAEWSAAHDAFDALPGIGTGPADTLDLPDGQQFLDDVVQALATALSKDDADHGTVPAGGYPLSGLIAPARGSGGGGGGGGAGGAAGPGRIGGGSQRQVLKGSSRGAAALAGAYALRNGDAAQLRELGLDFLELSSLPRRTQISRILQAVLGDAGHPDEAALRRATVKHVKEVLLAAEPPTPEDSLRGLVAEWIYELGLVELQSQKASDNLTPEEAVRKQGWLRSWLQRRVRHISVPDTRRMTVKEFTATAARVTREALRILRAGRS